MHEEHKGKVEVVSKVAVKNRDDLSTAYTPGVAEPYCHGSFCMALQHPVYMLYLDHLCP
jgi:malic enzyme